MFKISQSKMLEVVDKILSDLKVKTKGTSRSTACTISKNGKEIVYDENTDSNIVSFVSVKRFLMIIYLKLKGLLEIPNSCLLQKKLVFKTYSSLYAG